MPVIQTTFAGTKIVGRLCAGLPLCIRMPSLQIPSFLGNAKGILVPHNTTEAEFTHLQEELPDGVVVKRIEEKLSALGNIIACNDHVALLHPDADAV